MKWPNCEIFVSFRFINSRAHFFQLVFACGESQILAVRDYLAMVVVVVILIVNNEKLQLFYGDFDWSKIRSYNHHQLITTETCRGPVHLVRDWLVHSTLPPTSRKPVRDSLILLDVSFYKQAFWWHCDMCFLCVLRNTPPNANRIPHISHDKPLQRLDNFLKFLDPKLGQNPYSRSHRYWTPWRWLCSPMKSRRQSRWSGKLILVTQSLEENWHLRWNCILSQLEWQRNAISV